MLCTANYRVLNGVTGSPRQQSRASGLQGSSVGEQDGRRGGDLFKNTVTGQCRVSLPRRGGEQCARSKGSVMPSHPFFASVQTLPLQYHVSGPKKKTNLPYGRHMHMYPYLHNPLSFAVAVLLLWVLHCTTSVPFLPFSLHRACSSLAFLFI